MRLTNNPRHKCGVYCGRVLSGDGEHPVIVVVKSDFKDIILYDDTGTKPVLRKG